MKNMYLVLLLAVGFLGSESYAQELVQGAAIEFVKETHDYGKVENGSDKFCTFEFKNTGNEPLLITKAKGSCGCTIPSYPEHAIAPGESATIRVSYDTKRTGTFKKTVFITSNAVNAPTKEIYIKGEVKAPVVQEAPATPPVQPALRPKVEKAPNKSMKLKKVPANTSPASNL